jgi:hypothetical protein
MKRVALVGLALVLLLTLVGCAGTTASNDASGQVSEVTVGLDESYDDALPVVMQLVIGTFQLEGTELAVDGEQVSGLLPLWKTARSLTSSDTAAAQEVAVVVEQIQETMTLEQVSAIAEMALKRSDMATLMQEMGLEFGQRGAAGDQGSGGGRGEGRPGGAIPGGGGPGGGGPGQEISQEMRETMETRRASGEVRFSPVFFDALIELLEAKSG